MDIVTHGLLGSVVGQLGFRQRLGPWATWVAVGAAIIPDASMIVESLWLYTGREVDELSMIWSHRGISHSLLAVPVMALAVNFLWLRFKPKTVLSASFWAWYLCIFLGLLSHVLLDGCTGYGTQLLAPITNRLYAVDAIGMIDLTFTGILAAILLVLFVVRRIKPNSNRLTLVMAGAGFVLALLYISYGPARHAWNTSRYQHKIQKKQTTKPWTPLRRDY